MLKEDIQRVRHVTQHSARQQVVTVDAYVCSLTDSVTKVLWKQLLHVDIADTFIFQGI